MSLESLLKAKQEPQVLPDAPGGFVIYGAGTAGRDVYKILQKKKLPVKYFIDKDAARIGAVEGIKVIAPEQAAAMEKGGMCAVVGMFNGFVNSADIYRKLVSDGFEKVFSFYELYHMMPDEFGERYFMAPKEFLTGNAAVILETAGIWADNRSRELFERVMMFRYTADMQCSPGPEKKGFNYFPGDIPGWKFPARLIDCGAFTGDTLIDIKKYKGRMKSVMAFEPDLENYKKLSEAVKVSDVADETALFPCAVFSSTKQISFSAKHGGGSFISNSGDATIQAVSLDEALPAYKPDMIKMDIEGAEPEALNGARQMIIKHRPNLAMCVYHTPGHIWEIPQLINSWNLGYKLYLRAYNYHSFDTVMHAVRN